MKVISIVPRLPPAIDGVGDYALNLAIRLQQDFGIETLFVVGHPNELKETRVAGFSVYPVEHSVDQLTKQISTLASISCPILLHYVGYGYAKRGYPSWLIQGLEHWKHQNQGSRLITMFHEISASGPIWTSAFWLSTQQRNLAKRLVKVSDRILTSKQLYAEILDQLSQGKHTQIPTLPVFSNVGEPKQVLPLVNRNKQLVVFGGTAHRQRVYQSSLDILQTTCEILNIREVLDMGPMMDLPAKIGTVPITSLGSQPPPVVSQVLSHALVGFFNYPTDFLGKSGIFAAYCAHRMLPISANCETTGADAIIEGKHYWFPNGQSADLIDLKGLQAIANNAYAWYQTHNLCKQSEVFANFLESTH